MNRSDLKALKSETFLSGGKRTKAVSVRTYEDEIIDSTFNVDDDSNVVGGVPVIDEDGHIPHTVIKSNQNNGFPKISHERIDNTYVKEATPTGYKVLDNNGNFIFKTRVFTSDAEETMLPVYDCFVATITEDTDWTTMERSGNKRYDVVNISSFNLTLNYPGASNTLYDLGSATAVSTYVLAANSKITIIDNNQYLTITP